MSGRPGPAEGGAFPDPSRSAFRPAVVLVAVAVSVLAAMAFVVVNTFAPDLEAGRGGGADPFSRSAVGYAGLIRLLRETGAPVGIGRGAAPSKQQGGLLVLTPPAGAQPVEVERLARYDGAVLIIAPKWRAAPSRDHPGWATVTGLLAPVDAGHAVARPEIGALRRAVGASAPVLVSGNDPRSAGWRATRLAFGPVRRLQFQPSNGGVPVLVDGAGRAVLVGVGARRIFVLTDPDLVDNHGLADTATARSAVRLFNLLRGPNGPVRFDATLNGLATPRNLFRLALTPPFLAATLCALATLTLAGWRSLARFGPAARPGRAVALGKQALVETSAGLIQMAGRDGAMTARYAGVVRAALGRAVGAPRDWGPQALDAYLDRLGDPTGEKRPFSDLMAAAERPGASPAEALDRARGLFAWQAEVMRGRR